MSRRVVITGLGALSPIGNDAKTSWENAKKGVNGIDKITRFDTENYKCKLAAELKDFDVLNYLEKKESKRLDLSAIYALIASREAFKDAKLDEFKNLDRDRFGVILGNGVGGLQAHEDNINKLTAKGPSRVSPYYIPASISNLIPGHVAIDLQAYGDCYAVITACASATNAIGESFRKIKDGYLDTVVTGGCEASITPVGIAGFQVMTAVTTSEDKNRASIPFDAERNGFVMGEGAGIVVLEELEQAKARGAKIYAEVVGYGHSCDANHITAPLDTGEGAIKAYVQAANEANITPDQIDYVNAHGTSTPLNDKTESTVIKSFFKDHAKNVSVSSTKSMTGHLLGGSGGIEGIFAALATKDDFVPPTINYKVPDENCDIDMTPNKGKERTINYSLSSSLGFGGHNAVVIFKKY